MLFQKERSMPGKSDDDTDEDYDVKPYRVGQWVSNKTDKQCIYFEVYTFMCQLISTGINYSVYYM